MPWFLPTATGNSPRASRAVSPRSAWWHRCSKYARGTGATSAIQTSRIPSLSSALAWHHGSRDTNLGKEGSAKDARQPVATSRMHQDSSTSAPLPRLRQPKLSCRNGRLEAPKRIIVRPPSVMRCSVVGRCAALCNERSGVCTREQV
jgi:hypothetical protein